MKTKTQYVGGGKSLNLISGEMRVHACHAIHDTDEYNVELRGLDGSYVTFYTNREFPPGARALVDMSIATGGDGE